ncbi:polysaccharide deacetylase family protein [Arthrobacter sp. UM1]|uniref:polysaccharide deacetylase family protein n=1 Tax=Arthrobacter sp. UM1 TaxID=2766776 RepID=UPI001CF63A82|nr:polysaccharide deacetylase family protein [Arthrobacter sp. UM1]MCB4209159.1 polysaccharide deacetylase family protein [Arthrobacter sp. UM1]
MTISDEALLQAGFALPDGDAPIRDGDDAITQNARAAAAADAELGRRIATVAAATMQPIDAAASGLYQYGSNWRGLPMPTPADMPAILTGLGAVLNGDERLLVACDAPAAGTFETGTNWRGRPVGGGVSAVAVNAAVDRVRYGLARDLLQAKARRLHARTSPRAQVALVVDDYPAATLQLVLPLLAARNIPCSWALNGNAFDPGYSYARFSAGASWADIRALDPSRVEIVNHGASHADVRDVDALEAEILGSRARLRAETGQAILGWLPPGCDYPEGIRYKTAPLITDEEVYLGSEFARLVLGGHAWAGGTQRRPGDGGVITHPLDGRPVTLAGRQWLDYPDDAGVKPGGIGDRHVAAAIERGHGTILSLHACYLDGGGAPRRVTRAGFEGFLDRLAARRDAGDLDLVLLSQWHHTRITTS